MERQKGNKRAFFGLALIVVGFLLILTHFGFMPFNLRAVIISWPALLVLIGVVMLFSRQNAIGGWVLILIGGIFLMPRILPNYFEWHRLFWPVLLLGLGSIIIIREATKHKYIKSGSADFLDIVAIFGGGDRQITSQNFQGGRITAVFGGSKLDLRHARLSPGDNILDLLLIFGGIKLILPPGWDVKLEVTSIFGGFSDKRIFSNTDVKEPGKELIIKGIALFGGGDLVSL